MIQKIKQTFLHWGIYAFPLLLTGCVADVGYYGGPEAAGPEAEVILQLEVPGSALSEETVTTAPHEKIEDLIVVAFESTDGTAYVNGMQADEPYLYYTTATIRSQEGAVTQWTANVHTWEKAQTFVVIANAKSHVAEDGATPLSDRIEEILKAANSPLKPNAGSDFSTKRALLSQIVAAVGKGGKIDPAVPFLMYGESGPTKITDFNRTIADFEVTRMVARVNVKIDGDKNTGGNQSIEGFTPQSICFYNYYDKGCLLPSEDETAPRLPSAGPADDKDGLDYDFKSGELNDAVYLFEAANPSEDGGMERVLRPCLVVGGQWQGKTLYWRLDFKENGAYKHLLRNHSYNLTITDVIGGGSETPDEALKSVNAGMSATLVSWNDKNISGIDINGDFFFGISKLQYAFGKSGTAISASEHAPETQQVKATKGVTWTATLNAGWVRFVAGEDYQVTNGGKTATGTGKGPDKGTDLKFEVDAQGTDGAVRETTMIFALGGVLKNVKATISQDLTSPVFVRWDGQPVLFDEAGTYRQGCNITFGPENVKLRWRFTKGGLTQLEGTTQEGSAQSGSQDLSKTLSFDEIKASTPITLGNVSASAEPFFTHEGTLTLIAEKIDGEGADVINVPIRQVRYGARFPNPLYVFPEQKAQQTKVLSNFAWGCTENWIETPDVEGGNPIAELLASYSGSSSGQPATDVEEASELPLTTLANTSKALNKTGYARFTFDDAPWEATFGKPQADLEVTTGIYYGGHHWAYTIAHDREMTFKQYLNTPFEKIETIEGKTVIWEFPQNGELARLISSLPEMKDKKLFCEQTIERWAFMYHNTVPAPTNRPEFEQNGDWFCPLAENLYYQNGERKSMTFFKLRTNDFKPEAAFANYAFGWNKHWHSQWIDQSGEAIVGPDFELWIGVSHKWPHNGGFELYKQHLIKDLWSLNFTIRKIGTARTMPETWFGYSPGGLAYFGMVIHKEDGQPIRVRKLN